MRFLRKFIIPMIITSLFFLIHLQNLQREKFGYPLYSAIVKANYDNFLGILKTSLDPYSFFAVGKPPLPLIFQFITTHIFGFSAIGLLLPVLLASLLSGFILRLIIREVYPQERNYLVVLLYLVTPVTYVLARVNIADSIFILFLLTALYLLMRHLRSKAKFDLLFSLIFLVLAGYCKFYMTLLTSLAFFVLLLSKELSLKRRISYFLLYITSFVIPPILWAISYYLLPGKRPFLGGTGDSNPFNLIFLSQGLGRIFSSFSGTKLDFPVMPQTMAYPVYQKVGLGRLLHEPYLSQYGYYYGFAILFFILLIFKWRKGALDTKTLALPLWSLGSFAGITFSQGPVCCTHPYYSSLLLPGFLFAVVAIIELNNLKIIFLALCLNTFINYQIFHHYPERIFEKNYLIFSFIIFILLFIVTPLTRKIPNIGRFIFHALLALELLLAPFLVTQYTYENITLANRYGDPVAGSFGADTSNRRLLTVTLDQDHQIENVGQDTSLVEKLNPTLVDIILHSPSTLWASGTLRAYIAAPLQIATNRPILNIGGETGSESTIKLQAFTQLVGKKQLCYFTIGSRDVLLLSRRHSISIFSEEAYQIMLYVLDNGVRVPLPDDPLAPALYSLCK